MREGNLPLKGTNEEKALLANELKDIDKGKMAVEKISSLKSATLLFSAR